MTGFWPVHGKRFFNILLCQKKPDFITNRSPLLFWRLNDAISFTYPKPFRDIVFESNTALTMQLLKDLLQSLLELERSSGFLGYYIFVSSSCLPTSSLSHMLPFFNTQFEADKHNSCMIS